jgi:hypothetical protein
MMNFDSNYSGPLAAYGGLPVDVGGMWGGADCVRSTPHTTNINAGEAKKSRKKKT